MGRIDLLEDRSKFTTRALYYRGVGARGTLKHQLSGNFLAFSESAHQMEPETASGARKIKTCCIMGHPTEMAPQESQSPFHFPNTSVDKQILILISSN